jgi:hypothetical protein
MDASTGSPRALTIRLVGASHGPRKPKLTETERRNVELTKRNAELERKLHVTNVLIAERHPLRPMPIS